MKSGIRIIRHMLPDKSPLEPVYKRKDHMVEILVAGIPVLNWVDHAYAKVRIAHKGNYLGPDPKKHGILTGIYE